MKFLPPCPSLPDFTGLYRIFRYGPFHLIHLETRRKTQAEVITNMTRETCFRPVRDDAIVFNNPDFDETYGYRPLE